MYQVNGEQHLLDWLADNDSAIWDAVLEWLPLLASDPAGISTAVRERPGVPGYTARIPGTRAFVDYTVVEQFRTVLIIDVSDEDGGFQPAP